MSFIRRWCGLVELALDQKLTYVVLDTFLITSDTEHRISCFFKGSHCGLLGGPWPSHPKSECKMRRQMDADGQC